VRASLSAELGQPFDFVWTDRDELRCATAVDGNASSSATTIKENVTEDSPMVTTFFSLQLNIVIQYTVLLSHCFEVVDFGLQSELLRPFWV
jgi:hypothetical protein